jgi:arylsulfatase A-like enzyme
MRPSDGKQSHMPAKEIPLALRAVCLTFCMATVGFSADRPNILWITSEDNSPYLRCYGDPLAETPHLDALAEQGVRYRRAFANAPVCSASRSTLITGMYACSLGIQHHRSQVVIPDRFPLFPQLLRQAGYYCTNNSKTDYNIAGETRVWNESSKTAHYRNRPQGQPFFAVFNLTISHESQVAPKSGKTHFRIPPEKVSLPPYHPDTMEIRRDWANYYDDITRMDQQVGKLLQELEDAGLTDETIVFYFSDHGGALPRGKRDLHDSGTRIPMIIRVPGRWAKFAPANPGAWIEDPVSLVDLPPTLCNLAEIPIPANFQGKAFLGKKASARDVVFLFRGRMDERYDMVRAIRGRSFLYVRNYSPHRPAGQHYYYPFHVLPSMRSWNAEYRAGRCNPVQSAYWQTRLGEEFYDAGDDPFQIKSRIQDPLLKQEVDSLRKQLHAEILSIRDTGFIPEGMFDRLAGSKTIYDYAHSSAYPLERILDLANLASDGDSASVGIFIAAMKDPHPVVRYWGTLGCLILKEHAAAARESLQSCLRDDWFDVRVVAAEAIAYLGEETVATRTIAGVLRSGNPYEVLAAQNALDFMWQAGHLPLAAAQDLIRDTKAAEPGERIPQHLLHPSE